MSRNSRFDTMADGRPGGWGGWAWAKGKSKRRDALSVIRRERAQSFRRANREPRDKFGLQS
jgi:hypothetical protein